MTDTVVLLHPPTELAITECAWQLQPAYRGEPVLSPIDVSPPPPPPDGGTWRMDASWSTSDSGAVTIDSVALLCDEFWVTARPIEPTVNMIGGGSWSEIVPPDWAPDWLPVWMRRQVARVFGTRTWRNQGDTFNVTWTAEMHYADDGLAFM